MATLVDLNELGLPLANLVTRVRAGEEITIFDAGKPVARLLPLFSAGQTDQVSRQSGHGMFKGQVWMSDDFATPLTEGDLKDWGL